MAKAALSLRVKKENEIYQAKLDAERARKEGDKDSFSKATKRLMRLGVAVRASAKVNNDTEIISSKN